ncbi:hypothetical protein [Methanococcoides seepicolus]|uniref:Uncharacterized protein n=1 Tax=Methanococcoides seepicolus TaxID=2828780 RepID=A0A9E4ZGT0_9EURY|nr:hypothetical protein [Methanococcoides seepicolus]MCM1987801.1 hypothetical protein [Methanococcoides seepicolus]
MNKELESTIIPIVFWHQFHKDAAHSSLYQSTIPEAHELSRTSNDGKAVFDASPVVAKGKVFVNCDRESGSPRAPDGNTGNVPQRHTNSAPGTAEVVTISKVIDMYNARRFTGRFNHIHGGIAVLPL